MLVGRDGGGPITTIRKVWGNPELRAKARGPQKVDTRVQKCSWKSQFRLWCRVSFWVQLAPRFAHIHSPISTLEQRKGPRRQPRQRRHGYFALKSVAFLGIFPNNFKNGSWSPKSEGFLQNFFSNKNENETALWSRQHNDEQPLFGSRYYRVGKESQSCFQSYWRFHDSSSLIQKNSCIQTLENRVLASILGITHSLQPSIFEKKFRRIFTLLLWQ